jgi:hypothetical protein
MSRKKLRQLSLLSTFVLITTLGGYVSVPVIEAERVIVVRQDKKECA